LDELDPAAATVSERSLRLVHSEVDAIHLVDLSLRHANNALGV
jgi:hypothetical protein